MSLGHMLSWKTAYYDLLWPALRRLEPGRADAIVGGLGRLAHAAWPPRRGVMQRVKARLARLPHPPTERARFRRELAGNVARFLARDYPLDDLDDASAVARFTVEGEDLLDEALAQGKGLIVLGSHLGAHVAGLHWLYRRGLPVRLFVQRPRHVSRYLQARFDQADGPHPQADLFLKRGLPPREAADRVLRARAALRAGLPLYVSGDVPWPSPHARPGRLMGVRRPFLALWADLAAATGAPVLMLVCGHEPGGRFRLRFEPPFLVPPGGEPAAVAHYLARLDAAIAADPAEAVAHLTWPCYDPEVGALPETDIPPASSPTLARRSRSLTPA